MDLWVRSQKGLVLKKVDYFSIYHKEGENLYFIMDASSRFVLGEYETNERALEVLDEIQNILIDYSSMSRVVYKMPEE